jgi:single-stranded DNA-binding protein
METEKNIDKTVKGAIGSFFVNETRDGNVIGNCLLYADNEDGEIQVDENTFELPDNKYKLVFFGKNAVDQVKSKLTKGMLVEATGKFKERTYEKDGKQYTSNDITVNKFTILAKPTSGEKNAD